MIEVMIKQRLKAAVYGPNRPARRLTYVVFGAGQLKYRGIRSNQVWLI